MVYLSCMTTTTSSFDPAPFVCVNCGHEHHYEDDTIVCEGKIFCTDEDACERRMGRMEPLPDFGPDPEDAAPAHLDGDPDEGHMYPDDGDGYYDTDGWDD
jgi:hypothetical protein